jgi:methylamine---glutamate N-methyltransferase subunit A
MCGIAGYWRKQRNEGVSVGSVLLQMLTALGSRGPDSSGVAVYSDPSPQRWIVRVKLGTSHDRSKCADRITHAAACWGARDFSQNNVYLRFTLPEQNDPVPFLVAIESLEEEVEVVSLGKQLELVKQVGSPTNLERSFGVSTLDGSHGIGHTRLSTESIVDLSHSQPFWAHGHPDLAIAHNGHITNYHQLRRRYEQHGVCFHTENDSELVGIYLAHKLRLGETLQNALIGMTADLDGSFSCLVATDSQFAFVRDQFAFKPLVFAETDRFVCVATEEIAIRSAIPEDCRAREAGASEVRVWSR